MSTAIVTGAASGSGRAIAEKFTSNGYTVYGLDMDERGIKMAADEMPNLTPIVCDLSDLQAVIDLGTTVDVDNIDVLVNCAGKLDPGYSGGYGAERYIRTINSMLTAPMILTDMVLPGMYRRWETTQIPGGIVNIGSFYSLISGAIKGGYTAAKWGLQGTTMTVGLEAAKRTGVGVRTVLIAPPHVASPLLVKQNHDEAALLGETAEQRTEELIAQIPTGILGTPERVAGAIWWWWTSPDAIDITATAIDMSGGITAGFTDKARW